MRRWNRLNCFRCTKTVSWYYPHTKEASHKPMMICVCFQLRGLVNSKCTHAPFSGNFRGISVKFWRWGLPGVAAFVAVPVEFSSVFWEQRHVALYSDKGALVLDTFNTCFGYFGRFRLIYYSPRSWSSREDKSITGLQSATKCLRHCTQIG